MSSFLHPRCPLSDHPIGRGASGIVTEISTSIRKRQIQIDLLAT